MREWGLEASVLTQMCGEDGSSVTRFLVCTLMCKEMVPHLLSKTLATGQTLQEAAKAQPGQDAQVCMCAFSLPSSAEHLFGVPAASREESPEPACLGLLSLCRFLRVLLMLLSVSLAMWGTGSL